MESLHVCMLYNVQQHRVLRGTIASLVGSAQVHASLQRLVSPCCCCRQLSQVRMATCASTTLTWTTSPHDSSEHAAAAAA
jgi:hypothetical protein